MKIGNKDDINFSINSRNEHPPPHIHADTKQYSGTYLIKDCTARETNFPKHKEKKIKEWMKPRKSWLVEKWNEITKISKR